MGRFAAYDGYKKDFEVHVGPVGGVRDVVPFAAALRADVERVMGIAFDAHDDVRDPTGGYQFRYASGDLDLRLVVDEPEEEGPTHRVPAHAVPVSRSETVATSELVERLYDGLDAQGTYLLVVLEEQGMPIAANFDIGDDW
ncbi:hypothetical protein ABZ705_02615 [Streptomyces sp. NPDC006984]|uniref:hypothetical protein n=1 Tax=Streptomyces sp. NPDC006984 TaxID=3155463 RepID=UPI00340E4F5D